MSKLPELEAAMNAYFEEHIGDAGLGLEVLPGVAELLKALKVRRLQCIAPPCAVLLADRKKLQLRPTVLHVHSGGLQRHPRPLQGWFVLQSRLRSISRRHITCLLAVEQPTLSESG